MVGAKLYSIPEDRDGFIRKWKDIGIDTAFLGPTIWKDPQGFPKQLQENSIDTYLILQTFFDDTLDEHPQDYAITESGNLAKDEWVKFACPRAEGYLDGRIEQLKEGIESCHPTGISIDFIRYFAFWEKIHKENWQEKLEDSCFCPKCLQAFESTLSNDTSIAERSPQEAAEILHSKHRKDWVDFKHKTITQSFQRIIRDCKSKQEDLRVFFHALPWFEEQYDSAIKRIGGQNLKEISPICHGISPMCYSHMLYQDHHWVEALVKAQQKQSKAPIIPAIQVSDCYRNEKFSPDDFHNIVSSCLHATNGNLILWSWEYLKEAPEKIEILKDSLSSYTSL